MYWMLLPLRRYFDFNGRSRRKEFWLWFLFIILMIVVLSILDTVLGLGGSGQFGRNAIPAGTVGFGARTTGGILTGIFSLAILIPNIAVAVRRLHDTNRRGWWLLLPVIPYVIGFTFFIGGLFTRGSSALDGGTVVALGSIFLLAGFIAAIVLLVFYCLEGTRGVNRFGPDPKGSGEALDEVFR